MPIYEYKCENGHVFEALQKFSDDPLTDCEVCGAPVQRVLHSPAIHFKGSGFHNTDYGTKSKPVESKESGSGDSNGSGSSESSSSSSSSSDSGGSTGSGDKAGSSSSSSSSSSSASSD